jgi:putative transposase
MPWKEIRPMDERTRLIGDWLSDEYTIKELTESYGVSRKTIHKWTKRYEAEGPGALEERSRAPHTHPNATSAQIMNQIVSAKVKHPCWGPKKIVAWLKRHDSQYSWPAPSTAGDILKKAGLVKKRRLKHHTPPYSEPFKECEGPNAVWSMDYKGQFKMLDGKYCYPFTLTDNYSRYILACKGLLHPTYLTTRPLLERAFKEYGLPAAIRSDNGSPFASVGVGGLSQLGVWLIKLWIRPERIAAGHPEQNGRHERMHKSLKEATASPPRANLEQQQQAFDYHQREFNTERPHEALGQEVPASYYVPSLRLYPQKLPSVEYGLSYTVRQVRSNGEIKWKGGLLYVSQALIGEPVGLKQINESEWEMWFSFQPLGILDERVGKIRPVPQKKRGNM